eukprot:GHVR01009718.1.p1 GENE.GHVR01009718.1~~GHVR01009718.1.p1  ORF type:complete len:205 (+),score=72.55 GHVR01009718.1:309-923(+)
MVHLSLINPPQVINQFDVIQENIVGVPNNKHYNEYNECTDRVSYGNLGHKIIFFKNNYKNIYKNNYKNIYKNNYKNNCKNNSSSLAHNNKKRNTHTHTHIHTHKHTNTQTHNKNTTAESLSKWKTCVATSNPQAPLSSSPRRVEACEDFRNSIIKQLQERLHEQEKLLRICGPEVLAAAMKRLGIAPCEGVDDLSNIVSSYPVV